jgi:hypothetical protein
VASETYAIHYERPKKKVKPYSDSNFTAADSPVTLNVFTDLGAICYVGELNNDGTGDLLIGLSSDGINFDDNFELKAGETWEVNGYALIKLKITHSGTNSSYRARFFRGKRR